MLWLERLAEERIREAMERGEFDNLPFAGKPLVFPRDDLVPEDVRMAYKILKTAGFLPPEMELRKEIVTLKDLLATVEEDEERLSIARRINDRVLRWNVLMTRSFDRAEAEVIVRRCR